MSDMYYVMEWGFISIMHVVLKPEEKYTAVSLCGKRVGFPTWANPVKNYIQVEEYIDQPDFEFMDYGDTVSQGKICIRCLHVASLKLMIDEADATDL